MQEMGINRDSSRVKDFARDPQAPSFGGWKWLRWGMDGVLSLSSPRSDLAALHAALCGLCWRILGRAVIAPGVSLAQRTQAVWGVAPAVCSGSIAEYSHPSLQKGSKLGL